jgi:dihydrofolate reductase
MNEFHLLVVVSRNYKIRQNQSTPWHSKQFRSHFETLTRGNILLMGRTTFESLPDDCKPFLDRLNVVLTSESGKYQGIQSEHLMFSDLYKFDNLVLPEYPSSHVWVIGGKTAYESLINRCKNTQTFFLNT